jgi:hypothetical protein
MEQARGGIIRGGTNRHKLPPGPPEYVVFKAEDVMRYAEGLLSELNREEEDVD